MMMAVSSRSAMLGDRSDVTSSRQLLQSLECVAGKSSFHLMYCWKVIKRLIALCGYAFDIKKFQSMLKNKQLY